ncbi:MAG TPA: tetratricopeptide repeat protein [Candidatus Latescibacteria bacterium]|nr:tetratricopeptide repeat protein [Candidatus Latescibacterota bacterium]
MRAVLAVSPDNVPARLNLANLLLRRGDWREATGIHQGA